MIILSLETSSPVASLALTDDDDTLSEISLDSGLTHSRTLLPEIKNMLDRSGISVPDLSLLTVGLGPGSFTGLRIGLAAAKGLAFAAEKPLVGVPTLDAMAGSASRESTIICPVVDARKGQVYASLYRMDRNEGPRRLTAPDAYDASTLASIIEEETLFFGLGLKALGRKFEAGLAGLFRRGPRELDYPSASAVARIGRRLFLSGVESDPSRITPLYVRPPDIKRPGDR